MSSLATQNQETKHVKTKEFVLYLLGVFFYTCMTGMVGSYRSEYLVNVLQLTDSQVSLFNTLVNVIPFVLSFVISMYIGVIEIKITDTIHVKLSQTDEILFDGRKFPSQA